MTARVKIAGYDRAGALSCMDSAGVGLEGP